MLAGYFYVASRKGRVLGELGTPNKGIHWQETVYSKRVQSALNGDAVFFDVLREEAPFRDKYAGFRVRLVNVWDRPMQLTAQDSRLDIVQEALDTDETWKPIEYLPASWCGNSYHSLVLDPGAYWEFVVPRFQGAHETLLRLKLIAGSASSAEQTVDPSPTLPEIVSAPYWGHVNPGQFKVNRDDERPSQTEPASDTM